METLYADRQVRIPCSSGPRQVQLGDPLCHRQRGKSAAACGCILTMLTAYLLRVPIYAITTKMVPTITLFLEGSLAYNQDDVRQSRLLEYVRHN